MRRDFVAKEVLRQRVATVGLSRRSHLVRVAESSTRGIVHRRKGLPAFGFFYVGLGRESAEQRRLGTAVEEQIPLTPAFAIHTWGGVT